MSPVFILWLNPVERSYINPTIEMVIFSLRWVLPSSTGKLERQHLEVPCSGQFCCVGLSEGGWTVYSRQELSFQWLLSTTGYLAGIPASQGAHYVLFTIMPTLPSRQPEGSWSGITPEAGVSLQCLPATTAYLAGKPTLQGVGGSEPLDYHRCSGACCQDQFIHLLGTSGACWRDQFIPRLGFIWSLLSGPVHPSSGVHLSGAGQEAGALSSVPVLHHCNPSWLESRPYKGEFGVSSPY